jgi:hypothetical protein
MITGRQNCHQPMMEVIHGVIGNRMEAAVIFLASFIEITSQSDTKIFIFAAQANLFGPE